MSPSYFAGPAGHPRDDIIERKRDAPSGLQTTLPRRPPSAPKYFCGCAGHMAIGSVPCCGTLSAVAWPRNVVHPTSLQSSSAVLWSPVTHSSSRRGAGSCPGPQPCALPLGGDSGHVPAQALVETSHLEHGGVFRRCYCPGAAVFGHDHRP